MTLNLSSPFQMRDLYAGLCIRGPHPVPAMYAHLPHGLYRRLADEILHLPLLHGACGCCPALHLRDQLILHPSSAPSLGQTRPFQPRHSRKPNNCPLIEWEELKHVFSVFLHFEKKKILIYSPNVGLPCPFWSKKKKKKRLVLNISYTAQ